MPENNTIVPKGWQKKQFEDCVVLPTKIKGLKNSEYKASGLYPIFDQAKEYISGYTDDENFLNKNFPTILFGDHTRILKYIKSPFVLGADGTKIFWSKEGLDSDFLYYSLLNINIPNTGYNRHFKFLKDSEILVPPNKEQKKIAEILSSVDEEIQKVDELIIKTEKLKKSLTVKLFNESKVKKFINFSDLVSLSKSKIDPKDSGEEKYIGLEHIEQETSRLIGIGSSLDTTSIKSSFKKGNILFGKLRPYLRKYWKAEFDGVCTTEIFVFEPKTKDDTDFILQVIQSEEFIQYSVSKSFGTKMPRTDWKIISTFKIPDFSLEERMRIGLTLSEIGKRNKVGRELKEKLTQLKKGLMSDLLSGKVRTKHE